jgi:hypothetical protein
MSTACHRGIYQRDEMPREAIRGLRVVYPLDAYSQLGGAPSSRTPILYRTSQGTTRGAQTTEPGLGEVRVRSCT